MWYLQVSITRAKSEQSFPAKIEFPQKVIYFLQNYQCLSSNPLEWDNLSGHHQHFKAMQGSWLHQNHASQLKLQAAQLIPIFHVMKGFSMKRCFIKVLIQNLRTLMGSFKRKMCYASRLKKGTIKRLKFSIKNFPNIYLSPKILIRMESLC